MGLGLFGSKNRNWEILRKQEYGKQVKNRDVHGSQTVERGERGVVEKPIKERILAAFVGLIFSVLGFFIGYILLMAWGFYKFVVTSEGASFLDYDPTAMNILGGWQIYAWTGFVFLMAWLIANERMMAGWRSKNSMIDATDINTYENDQHIMYPEELYRTYDLFPNTGAHSSVQVSSMLSHMMIDRKGIKRVEVVERHTKDVKEGGRIIAYKGEPVVNDDGETVIRTLPLIDEEFGQELYTASGIPVKEKEKRTPVDVRKIEYNPLDHSGNRSDRDKQPYDTLAELINKDWEFPEYEVQRPSGAYLVDTAPVNTMVLAITRAGKGSLARFV